MSKKLKTFTDRASLLAVAVPQRTESYTPISIQSIFETIDRLVKERGLVISGEEFFMSSQGQRQRLRFFFHGDDAEFKRELIMISSYDKSIALRGAAGMNVFVCSNGVIVGDILIYNKHTGAVDEKLDDFLNSCFVEMENAYRHILETSASFKKTIINEEAIGQIVGECLWKEYISSSAFHIIKKEYEKPSYNYNCDPKSLWALYNHVTLAMKDQRPENYLENRQGVQEVFAKFYNDYNNDYITDYTFYEEV